VKVKFSGPWAICFYASHAARIIDLLNNARGTAGRIIIKFAQCALIYRTAHRELC